MCWFRIVAFALVYSKPMKLELDDMMDGVIVNYWGCSLREWFYVVSLGLRGFID